MHGWQGLSHGSWLFWEDVCEWRWQVKCSLELKNLKEEADENYESGISDDDQETKN